MPLFRGTEGSNPSPSRKESTANLTADDLLAGRAIKDAPLALGEDALNQRHNRKNGYEIGVIGSATDH
jgi:hypothetical protein